MEKIYIVGHKKPDTDSICTPIAYAEYLKQKGKNAVACRTGEINPETKFVLEYFKIKAPELLSDAKGKNIILLDHNAETQSPDNIKEAEIIEVIDHHKVEFEYDKPILFHTEPIGATSSIIAKKYLGDEKAKLTKEIAGILLSSILSDTVVFRSPTATDEDREIAEKLAEIAGIKDLEEFGIKIKKQKASLKGLSAKDIIFSDFKEYKIGEKLVATVQLELCGLEEVEERKQELFKEMEKAAKDRNYDIFILLATDIIKMSSELIFWEKENYIEKVFGKKPENNSIYLEGVISRKKQIIPPLTKFFLKK